MFGQQQADHSATTETESSNTDKSRPGKRSGGPSKPAAPVKLDRKLTKPNQKPVEQDRKSTLQDQKPIIPVKQAATEDQLGSSQEKLHTPGHAESREGEISAEEKEKETPAESSTKEENISPAIVIEKVWTFPFSHLTLCFPCSYNISLQNQAGYLDGYSSCRVDLAFSPTTASPSSQIFTISFTQTGVKPVSCFNTTLPFVPTHSDSVSLRVPTI